MQKLFLEIPTHFKIVVEFNLISICLIEAYRAFCIPTIWHLPKRRISSCSKQYCNTIYTVNPTQMRFFFARLRFQYHESRLDYVLNQRFTMTSTQTYTTNSFTRLWTTCISRLMKAVDDMLDTLITGVTFSYSYPNYTEDLESCPLSELLDRRFFFVGEDTAT